MSSFPTKCNDVFKILIDKNYIIPVTGKKKLYIQNPSNEKINWADFESIPDWQQFKEKYIGGFYNLVVKGQPFSNGNYCDSVDEFMVKDKNLSKPVEPEPNVVQGQVSYTPQPEESLPENVDAIPTQGLPQQDNQLPKDIYNKVAEQSLYSTPDNQLVQSQPNAMTTPSVTQSQNLQESNNQVSLMSGPLSDITKKVIEMVLKKLETRSIGLITEGLYKINIDFHLLKSSANKLYISTINVTIDYLNNEPSDAVIIVSNNPNEINMLSIENMIDDKVKYIISEDVKQLRKLYDEPNEQIMSFEPENITQGNALHIKYNLFLNKNKVSINFDVIEYLPIKETGMIGTPISKDIASNIISNSINITTLQENIQSENVLNDLNNAYASSNQLSESVGNKNIGALRELEFTDEEIKGNITPEMVSKKFRTLAAKYHPQGSQPNPEKFQKINEAKDSLNPNTAELTGGKRKRKTLKRRKTQMKKRKTNKKTVKKTLKRSKKQGKKRNTSKK